MAAASCGCRSSAIEPGRPGGPVQIVAGREITRSHYELIADRQTGLKVGETIHLGRNDYTVVGETKGVVTLSGDSIVYVSLRDAQQLQFELAPPAARREAARGAQRAQTDLVNAVVAKLAADVPPDEVAEAIRRWHHLSVLTDAPAAGIPDPQCDRAGAPPAWPVHGHPHGGLGRDHCPHHLHNDDGQDPGDRDLKLIGAADRTIIGLILQQALLMGVVGFAAGTVMVYLFKGWFPRRIVMLPEDIAAMFGVRGDRLPAGEHPRCAGRPAHRRCPRPDGVMPCNTISNLIPWSS